MEPWAECNQRDENEKRIRDTIEFILSTKLFSHNINDEEKGNEIDQNITKTDEEVNQNNSNINEIDLNHDDSQSVVILNETVCKIKATLAEKSEKLNDDDGDELSIIIPGTDLESKNKSADESNKTPEKAFESLDNFSSPQEVPRLEEDDGDELSIIIPETDSESKNEFADESNISISETKKTPAKAFDSLENYCSPQEVPCLENIAHNLSFIIPETDSESEYESGEESIISITETNESGDLFITISETDSESQNESESFDESIISISDSNESLNTQLQSEESLAARPEEISEQDDATNDTSILNVKLYNDATDITIPKLPTCDNSLPPYPSPNDKSSVDIVAKAVHAFNLVDTPVSRQRKYGTNKLAGLAYLDLSKDVVKDFATTPTSNQVDNDETFKSRLDKFLGSPNKKRRLFTPNFYGDDIGNHMQNEKTKDKTVEHTSEIRTIITNTRLPDASSLVLPLPSISTSPTPTVTDQTRRACLSTNFALSLIQKNVLAINACSVAANMNKHMKSIQSTMITEPQNDLACRRHQYVIKYLNEYDLKFSFLKSLDQSTPEFMCHPDAIKFYGNFEENKEHLAIIIYDILNHKVFNCAMKVGILWNKKVTKISHCLNTTKGGNLRISAIELSSVLIISAQSLIVALTHEMCHAAAWLYSGEIGHGDVCKAWLLHARQILPEIPQIEDCGRLAHLYTYSCPLCEAKSQGSFKMKQKLDNVRCIYCYGPIQIGEVNAKQDNPLTKFTNKKDLTGFALFIKKNYRSMIATTTCHKKHSEIMHALSEQYNLQ